MAGRMWREGNGGLKEKRFRASPSESVLLGGGVGRGNENVPSVRHTGRDSASVVG